MKVSKYSHIICVRSFLLLGGFLFGFCVGCSDQPRSTWYEDSQRERDNRNEYIESQAAQGIDPDVARRNWDVRVWTLNTEGKDPKSMYEK